MTTRGPRRFVPGRISGAEWIPEEFHATLYARDLAPIRSRARGREAEDPNGRKSASGPELRRLELDRAFEDSLQNLERRLNRIGKRISTLQHRGD